MEKILYFDAQGRLYFPEEIRKFLRFKTLVAKTVGTSIVIEPIEDNPLEALARLGKGKMKGKSIVQLKKEARKELEEHVTKKLRR